MWGLLGYHLAQAGTGASLAAAVFVWQGNPWGLLLAPVATAAFVLAALSMRRLVAALRG